uniref:Uncharacterized protein n=1 Tax=Romanomermis culicivorax TaxID=13658 RepID=A0A915JEZ8_ROMCU
SVQVVRAEDDSDLSHNRLLSKSDEEIICSQNPKFANFTSSTASANITVRGDNGAVENSTSSGPQQWSTEKQPFISNSTTDGRQSSTLSLSSFSEKAGKIKSLRQYFKKVPRVKYQDKAENSA